MKTAYQISLSPLEVQAVQGLDCTAGLLTIHPDITRYGMAGTIQGYRDGMQRVLAGLALAMLALERKTLLGLTTEEAHPDDVEKALKVARRASFPLTITILKLAAELASV